MKSEPMANVVPIDAPTQLVPAMFAVTADDPFVYKVMKLDAFKVAQNTETPAPAEVPHPGPVGGAAHPWFIQYP
jgi:hypothetical protein